MTESSVMITRMQEQLMSELTGKGDETLKNTPVSFSMAVERLATKEGCTLLEALTAVVEEHKLDPDQVPKLVTAGLKQKLAYENGIENPGVALVI